MIKTAFFKITLSNQKTAESAFFKINLSNKKRLMKTAFFKVTISYQKKADEKLIKQSPSVHNQTSPKGFSASKCDEGNRILSKS